MEPRTPHTARHLCLLLAVGAILIGHSSSASIDLDQTPHVGCVRSCTPPKDNSVFSFFGGSNTVSDNKLSVKFEQGQTYQYRVETSNKIFDRPVVGMKALALITPVSPCELSLQLRQVQIENLIPEQDESVSQLVSQLELPILFGYREGVVTELCPDSTDNWFATNLKKSIISTLQTTPQLNRLNEPIKVVESDFHGECETEYEVVPDQSRLLITKQKDLLKCVNLEYPTKSEEQSIFLGRNATLSCQQLVDNQRMTLAECEGRRLIDSAMLPYLTTDYHRQNQAPVELLSRVLLRLEKSVHSDQLSAQIPEKWERHAHHLLMTRPTSKMHFYQSKPSTGNLIQDGQAQLTSLLREICADMDSNQGRIGSTTPTQVRQLVQLLEQINQQDVQFVWDNLIDKDIVCEDRKLSKKLRDIFVDTTASLVHTNSVQVVRHELTRYQQERQSPKDIVQQFGRARYLATLLAFAANPEAEAVHQLVSELLPSTDDSHIVLSLSGLVRKTRHQLDTTFLEHSFELVLQKIQKLLTRVTPENDAQVLRLLKALENIAPATELDSQTILTKMFNDKRMPTSVRFGAIRAMEAVRMMVKARQSLINLFNDRHEPNEVRIAAYRTLVHSEVTIDELKQILDMVEQEQDSNLDVYNYVCSHQKNLRSTQHISKRSLLPLEAPLFPEPKSLTNFLLSRNFEWNLVNSKTSVGPLVEADIVMAKESRVPRYLSLNLTVPVADQTIQVVEITVRQQGLERSVMERLDKLRKLVQNPAAALRELRQIVLQQQTGAFLDSEKRGKLQIFFNVDGKNVLVWDSAESQMEQDVVVTGFWQQLTKHLPISVDETAVLMPFRHRVELPTASGIPMTFQLNTTLIGSLESQLTGHSQPDDSLLEILLKPTFVMEIAVGLEADLPISVAAKPRRVQFAHRFISAPTLHLKTELKENKHLRLKFLLPEQEQTIARFETELIQDESQLNRYDSMEQPSKSLRRTLLNKRHLENENSNLEQQQSKCSPTMSRMLGFTLCSKHFSTVDFDKFDQRDQLGQNKFVYETEIKLKKTDQQMEGIQLTVELPQTIFPRDNQNHSEIKFVLHFDTPNSEISRRMATELLVRLPSTDETKSDQKYQIELHLESPIYKFSGQLILLNQPNEKALHIELLSDRKQRQFLLEVGSLMSVQDPSNRILKLQLRLQPTARSELLQMEGQVVLNRKQNGKTNLELKLDAQQKNIVQVSMVKSGGQLFDHDDYKLAVNAKVDCLGLRLETSLLTSKDQQTGTLKSSGQFKYNHFWTVQDKIESVDYLFQLTGFETEMGTPTKKNELKKFVHWSLTCSQYPLIGHELTYHISGDLSKQLNQQLSLKYSLSQEPKHIRLTHQSRMLQNPRTRQSAKLDTQIELECLGDERFACHHGLALLLDLQPDNKHYALDLTLDNRKTGQVTLESHCSYIITSTRPLAIETKAEIKVLGAQYHWQYDDQLKQTESGVLEGKTVINMPRAEEISRMMPEKIELNYQYTNKDKRDIVAQFETPEEVAQFVRELIRSMAEFKHELVLHYGPQGLDQTVRHFSLLAVDQTQGLYSDYRKFTYKSKLEQLNKANSPLIYDFEMDLSPIERELNLKLETNRFMPIKIELETKLKDLVKLDCRVETDQFQHQTIVEYNPSQKIYQLDCFTKPKQSYLHNSFADFRISARKEPKLIEFNAKTSLIIGEARFENVPQMVKAILKRRPAKEQATVKVDFQIPSLELEHESNLECKSNFECFLRSQTKHSQQNLLRLNVKMTESERSAEAEYLVGYLATAKLNQLDEDHFELVVEGRNQPRQWSHFTKANWQYPTNSLKDLLVESFETKNHLADKSLLDLTYMRNEKSQRYQHKIVLSTRMTHAELSTSSNFWDDHSDQPKALFTLRSKRFGGIEHHTEIEKFNPKELELTLNSKTVRAGNDLLDLDCDVALFTERESIVKGSMGEQHRIEMRFVPNKSFRCQLTLLQRQHLARFERQSPEKWNLDLESIELKSHSDEQTQWKIHVEHQCDQQTRIQIKTPIVRGEAEVKMASNEDKYYSNELKDQPKSVRIELKGVGLYSQYDHNTLATLERNSDMSRQFSIQSRTEKSGKQFVVVEAEINSDRESIFKLQVLPAEFEFELEFEPRVGGQAKLIWKEYEYLAELRRQTKEPQLVARIEARAEKRNLFKLESKYQNGKNLQLNVDSELDFLPIAVQFKCDFLDRDIYAEFEHKPSDRVIKLEALLADLKQCKLVVAWDAKRDITKLISIELSVQEEKVDRNRFVALSSGQILGNTFEVKIDLDRNQLVRGSHQMSGQLINQQQDKYQAKYEHRYRAEQKDCHSLFTLNKNEFKMLQLSLQIDVNQPERKVIKLECESDYQTDLLNLSAEFDRDCKQKGQCLTRAVVNYGGQQQDRKQFKLELTNDLQSIRGELLFDHPLLTPKQTLKFEWVKAESKLQVNLYNESGRQLDLNVDLVGKPLQKKFQMVSFIESIPTVNLEAEYGENSRIVLEFSFKEDKKAELSLNWFGQWRRDFKLQALFKCYYKPSIELMVTSRHPAAGDQIEAMLKLNNKQYSAKWNRQLGESGTEEAEDWTTQALVSGPQGKVLELNLKRLERKMDNQQVVVIYTAQLEGQLVTKPVDGQLLVIKRRGEDAVEKVKLDCQYRDQQKLCTVEIYCGSQERTESPIRTGLRLIVQDNIIFGAVYAVNADNDKSRDRRSSLVHIELPSEIEYMLRNEIEYQRVNQEQVISSVRSELKRKSSESLEPIYETRMWFEQDPIEQDQIIRVQVNSVHFRNNNSKMFELRYNFQPKECHTLLGLADMENKQRMETLDDARCWRVQLTAGELDQPATTATTTTMTKLKTLPITNGIRMSAEYLRTPIEGGHFNRTARFSVKSLVKPSRMTQTMPINFSVLGHLSVYSTGLQWDNLDRYGQPRSGIFYIDARPNSQVQFMLAHLNRHQPSKDLRFGLAFNPENVRKSLRVDTKWDHDRVRAWLVGELPRLHQLSSESGAQLKSRFERELRAEMRTKIRALRQTFDQELVEPLAQEAKHIQRKLKNSEQEMVVNAARWFDQLTTQLEQVGRQMKLYQWTEQLCQFVSTSIQQLAKTLKLKSEQVEEMLIQQCKEIDLCRQMLDQVLDYEITKFVKRSMQELNEKFKSSLDENIPEQVRKAFTELRQQLIQHNSNHEVQYHQEHQQQPRVNLAKHSIRLLRMSQPVLVDHMANIVRELTQSQDSKPTNWQSVRGSLHDMAVDLVDQMQPKTKDTGASFHQQQQPSSTFWDQLGLTSHFNQKQQSEQDYIKASPYDYSSPINYRHLADNKAQFLPMNQSADKSNFVFSPKRGEFKIFPQLNSELTTATNNLTGSGYWTRA